MAGKKLEKKMKKKNNRSVEKEARPMGLLAQQMADPVASQNVDSALQGQVDSVVAGLMRITHGKETRNSILEQLKTGPPETSIPTTMMMVVSLFEQGASSKNKTIPQDVKVASYVTLVLDLIELSNAAGLSKINLEDQNAVSIILENSLKKYIEKGLKDGTIDPIALQKQIEPLMSPEQKAVGQSAAQKTGIPMEPTAGMAQQKILGDAKKPLEEENAKLKGLLAQAQQQGQVQPQAQQQGNVQQGGM